MTTVVTLLFLSVAVPLVVLAVVFFKPAKERAFECQLDNRPQLDDDAFYEKFYASTATPRVIPIQLRRVYAAQLGRRWANVFPQDNPAQVYGDLDLADLLAVVGKEFDVPFPIEAMRRLDGSFDSVVKYLKGKVVRPS